MNKWFAGVTTIEELRKRYRELLKQFHPDNGGGEETMKAINIEYDKLFDALNKKVSQTVRLIPMTKTPRIKHLKRY